MGAFLCPPKFCKVPIIRGALTAILRGAYQSAPLTVTKTPVSGLVSNVFPDRLVAAFHKMKLEQLV